jgi:Cof subfamily protein (haloacid dehalogenase superfamily)
MAIRLLALDIDGTLLNGRGEVTSRTRTRIEEARARGVLVALVTGRRFGSARLLVEEQNLAPCVPLISHNGALTKNISSLETISFHPLELETAREVVRLGREHGVDALCCDDPHGLGVMALEGVSPENKAMQRYLDKYRDSVRDVPDLLEYLDHAPIQMMFSGRCAWMEDFAEELRAALGERVSLFRTRYPKADLTILDVLSPAASKGDGLAAVAAAHGVAREEIMAVGDNHNDITMLSYAGLGVVMANAEEELKQMGFALTASNEEDGVAEAIEKYILRRC